MDIIESARTRLKAHRQTVNIKDVSEQSGLSLGWLSEFATGKIEFPASRQLSILLKYLAEVEG